MYDTPLDRRSLRLVLTALVLALGCSDSSTPPTEPPDPGPLDGVTLRVDTVGSLGRVYVDGLPEPRGDQGLRMLILDPSGDIELPLESDGDGRYFHAPVHPESPVEGGAVTVVADDGEHRSPELPLMLEPLPEAPGAYGALVAALRAHVEQRAEWAGTSFDALAAMSFDAVEPALIPLKIAQTTVDAPDEENDLTDLVSNTSGYLSADERELLDRYCGYTGFAELVQNEIDEFTATSDTLPAPRGVRSAAWPRGTCFNTSPEIGSAQELSEAMIFSALADLYTDPSGPAGTAWMDVGIIIGGVGLIPGAGGAAAIVGVGLVALQSAGQYIGGVYPSAFESLDFDVDRTEFEEDFPDFARWQNVEVVATSRGWSADGSIANAVITAIGGVLSEANKAQILESDLLRDMLVTDVNLGLGAFLNEFETGIIEFCPDQWTIDITDLPFSTAQALNGRLDVDPAVREVRVREAGEDFLRVAAQAVKFGGRSVFRDEPMLVREIIVEVTPNTIVVKKAGETVDITATITNADLTTLLWLAEHGTWDDGFLDETNDGRTRPLKTPQAPSVYPFDVEVESLSRQGARKTGKPRRWDFCRIRLAETSISITPPFACVDNGDTTRFEAEVVGVKDPMVVWSIHQGFGTIDPDTGVYTAPPAGTTDDVIKAELVGEDGVVAYASVRGGTCNCFYNLSVIGDYMGTTGSPDIAYTIFAPEGEILQMQFFVEVPVLPGQAEGQGVGVSIATEDPADMPQPGMDCSAPGADCTYEVNFVYTAPGGQFSWTASTEDTDHSGVFLHLDEFDENATFMRGTFAGTAVDRNENGDISSLISVSMPFRAGHFDGGWPCTE